MNETMAKKRKLKIMLMAAGIIIVLLAGGLMAMTFLSDREASATSNEDALDVKAMEIETSGDRAEELFSKKVEDTNDTAAVAELLETMGMGEAAGEYTVRIAAEGEEQVMNLTVAGPVQSADREVFDANMQIMAEQLLALTSGVTKVQWSYPVLTADAREETVTVSLDQAGAGEELGRKVKNLGESAEKVRTLLRIQAGES